MVYCLAVGYIKLAVFGVWINFKGLIYYRAVKWVYRTLNIFDGFIFIRAVICLNLFGCFLNLISDGKHLGFDSVKLRNHIVLRGVLLLL